jgi:hypothetical protein
MLGAVWRAALGEFSVAPLCLTLESSPMSAGSKLSELAFFSVDVGPLAQYTN